MTKDMLAERLNIAIAAEKASEEILESHSVDSRDYPDLRDKMLEHIQRSKEAQEKLRSAIGLVSGKVSEKKIEDAKELSKSFATELGKDILMNSHIAIGLGHFRISMYSSLILLADRLGQQQVVTICKDIQLEAIELATWLENYLPIILREQIDFTGEGMAEGETA